MNPMRVMMDGGKRHMATGAVHVVVPDEDRGREIVINISPWNIQIESRDLQTKERTPVSQLFWQHVPTGKGT